LELKRHDTFVEVAWPPYAYVMTIDSEPGALETVDITAMVDFGYEERVDFHLDLLIGFGHTAIPVDYRTIAMIERDRALNQADADGVEPRVTAEALTEWIAAQHHNPLIAEGSDVIYLTGRLPDPK
jgi:hypothetical protein